MTTLMIKDLPRMDECGRAVMQQVIGGRSFLNALTDSIDPFEMAQTYIARQQLKQML